MISTISLVWLLFISITGAAPEVAFPFNSQVPPVARVGQPFNFTFSPTTFTPNGESFQYSIDSGPAWLVLDSASRTLSGIPAVSDVGSPTMTIIASDGTEKTAMEATLVVVSYEGPEPVGNISTSLAKAGKLCGLTRLTVHPRSSFSFEFDRNTFSGTTRNVSYYSTLSDHTPLPGWLVFDPTSLRFSGVAPVLSASPQQFDILFIVTDVLGFAASWVIFTIVVSDHQFYFQNLTYTFYAGSGKSFSVNDLRSHLILDGNPVGDSDMVNADATNPSWLSFNTKFLNISGMPPPGMKGQEVSVVAYDGFGDTADVVLDLQVVSNLFNKDIGTLDVAIGQPFSYIFDQSLFSRNDLRITVDLGSASSWLRFDPNKLELSGTTPRNVSPGEVSAMLNAVSSDGLQKGSQGFTIAIHPAQTATSTISPRSSNSSLISATGGVFAATGTPGKTNPKKTAGIVIGVIIAIIFAIVCLVLAVWLCRSPRSGIKRTHSALKRTISRPVHTDGHSLSAEAHGGQNDLEKGSDEFGRTTDHPPQIVLNLSPKKTQRRSSYLGFRTASPVKRTFTELGAKRMSTASSTINDGDAMILDNINRSSWGYTGASTITHNPHDSMKLATHMARLSRRVDSNSLTHRRLSQDPSYNGMVPTIARGSDCVRITSSGIPVNPRLLGLGHGRSPPGPNRYSVIRLLQAQEQPRVTSYSDSVSTGSTSMLFSPHAPLGSVDLSRQSSHYGDPRRSMRESAFPETRRTSVQRPLPRRRQHRSPFFSGGPSSRGSSSSHHRSTGLGLSTIRGSPDLSVEPPAVKSGRAHTHTMVETNTTDMKGESSTSAARQAQSLCRNPTQTSSKTAKTWQTATTASYQTTATGSEASLEQQQQQRLLVPPPVPARHPGHVKRWSSHLRSRLTQPQDGSIRESTLFASADEENMSTSDEGRISSSLYSQSQSSVALPTSTNPSPERPPTRGKIPIGGVRVPPFGGPVISKSSSIMNRPHPKASFKQDGVEKRRPLSRLRGGENRIGGAAVEKVSEERKERSLRPRLRSARGKRPVSTESVEKVYSVKARLERPSESPARGNEAFL